MSAADNPHLKETQAPALENAGEKNPAEKDKRVSEEKLHHTTYKDIEVQIDTKLGNVAENEGVWSDMIGRLHQQYSVKCPDDNNIFTVVFSDAIN